MTFAGRVATALVIGTLFVGSADAQERAPTMGRSIASLSHVALKSRDGTDIQLGSRVKPGKPTLIAFWASWCMPCLVEAPYLKKIRTSLGDRYNFVYINRREGDPDPDQPPAAVARFLERSSMADVDYVIADVKAYRQLVGKDLRDIPEGKVGIPRIYLFDRNGRQIYTTYGFTESDGPELERRVKQAAGK